MSNNVIPKLFQLQEDVDTKMPRILHYLYFIFLFLVMFGILLPLSFLIFNLPVLLLIVSYASIISIIFFLTTTFYQFLTKEINS